MRNMFYKLGMAIQRFMYGRNGTDALGVTALVAYLVFSILANILYGVSETAYILLVLEAYICLCYYFFRFLSRNVLKRRAENAAFKRFFAKIKTRVSGFVTRVKDKEHKYYKCKKCKAVLRVPRGRGKIVITCPKCRNKFDAKT